MVERKSCLFYVTEFIGTVEKKLKPGKLESPNDS